MKKKFYYLILVLLLVLAISFLLKFFTPLLSFFNSKPKYSTTDETMVTNKERAIINDVVKKVTNKVIIGIHYRIIDKQTASQNNIVEGAYITQVIKGSPAEKADLREEDIITQFDDRKISGTDELKILTNLITNKKPGDKVNLKIWRNKKIMDVSIVLDKDQ